MNSETELPSEKMPVMTSLPKMSPIKHLSWALLGFSATLGLIGSVVLHVPWGLNIALWISLLLVLGWFFVKQFELPNQVWWFWITALVFAWCFVLRDSSLLRFWDGLAMLLALALAAAYARFGIDSNGFLALMFMWLEGIAQTLFGWISFALREVPWQQATVRTDPKRIMPFLRGVLFLIPLLLIFGAMLGSADAVFANLIKQLFSWQINSSFWWWLTRFLLISALILGLFRLMVMGHNPLPPLQTMQVGRIELMIVLSGLNALFAVFIAIQFGYFFGGQTQITALTGLTYADYARRGFNELVQVVALAFPVLITSLHFAQTDQKTKQIVRVLSSITLVLLGMMLFSAWQRLGLYRDAYGLTEIRFYTAVCLIWLAVMLVFYAMTALRERYLRFVQGVIISAFLTLLTLNLVNPIAMIVETNLARGTNAEDFDLEYAIKLGADAVPSLMLARNQFPKEQQMRLTLELKQRWGFVNTDWRSWNFAINQAHDLIK